MTPRRAATLAVCLLVSIVLSLLTGCAAEPAVDVAAVYFEQMEQIMVAQNEDVRFVPIEFTRLDDGKLYSFTARYPGPYDADIDRIYRVSCEHPEWDTPPFSIAVTDVQALEVMFTLVNHTDTAQAAPPYLTVDVMLDGDWYQHSYWAPPKIDYSMGRWYQGLPVEEVAAGAEEQGRFSLLGSSCVIEISVPLMAGHYRLGVSSDPEQGWVFAPFDVTQEQAASWGGVLAPTGDDDGQAT